MKKGNKQTTIPKTARGTAPAQKLRNGRFTPPAPPPEEPAP